MTTSTQQPFSKSKRKEVTMKIRTVAQYEKALITIESLMNAFPDGENAANDSKIA